MTNKQSWRLSLALVAVVVVLAVMFGAILTLNPATAKADGSPITVVDATWDFETSLTVGVVTKCLAGQDYGSWNYMLGRIIAEKAGGYYGKVVGYLYTYDDQEENNEGGLIGLWSDWTDDYYFSVGVSDEDYVLPVGQYTYKIEWEDNGSYAEGEMWGTFTVEVTDYIAPTFEYTDFTDLTYGGTYNFLVNDTWKPDPSALLDLTWYYKVGDEEFEFTNATAAGTYSIYPRVSGDHAAGYNVSFSRTDEFMISYDLDEDNPVEVTVSKKNLGTKNYTYNFAAGGTYGVYWDFLTDNAWMESYRPAGADVYVNWYYMDGDNKVSLTPSTADVGTYSIYVELTGNDADNYEYLAIYGGSKMFPVSFTISPKEITDPKMRVGVDTMGKEIALYVAGDPEVNTDLYYNPNGLTFSVGSSSDVDALFTVDGWATSEGGSKAYDTIGDELGEFYTTGFTCTTPNYVLSDDFVAKVTVGKRVFTIAENTTVRYTGSAVKPDFYLYAYYNDGEEYNYEKWDIVTDEGLMNTVLGTAVGDGTEGGGDHYHYGVQVTDSELYTIYVMMLDEYHISYTWDYSVLKGQVKYNVAQPTPVYYGETIEDITDKFVVTVTTNDIPEDQVEVTEIKWSVDGYSYNPAVPSSGEIPEAGQDFFIRIRTSASESTNYDEDVYFFVTTVAKAPVYVRYRPDESHIYNAQEQHIDPKYLDFYIYKAGDDDYLDYKIAGAPLFFNSREEQERIGHDFATVAGTQADEYALTVDLEPSFKANYEIVYDDRATWKIYKKELTQTITVEDPIYGEGLVYSVEYSGFAEGETYDSVVAVDPVFDHVWTYANSTQYSADTWLNIGDYNKDSWVPAGINYHLKHTAQFLNYYVPDEEEVFDVKQRPVSITWTDGKGNNYTDVQALDGITAQGFAWQMAGTYTYSGSNILPEYALGNIMENDTVEVTNTERHPLKYDNELSKWQIDFEGGIISTNAGRYTYSLAVLDNPNYTLVGINPGVNFEIVKADLAITVDNKAITYGDEAPDYTLSYSGFVGGENYTNLANLTTPACSYVQWDAVDSYDITLAAFEDKNYNISITNGTLTVSKASMTEVTAPQQNGALTYDGSAQAPTVAWNYTTLRGADVPTISYKLNPADAYGDLPTFTDWTSGSKVYYKVSCDNYNDVTGNFNVVVARRTVTFTFDGNKVFNGTSQKPTVVASDGIVEGDVVYPQFPDSNTLIGAFTGAWAIDFTLAGADSANYVCDSYTADLVIAPLPLSFNWTAEGSDNFNYTYSGSECKPVATATNLVAGYTNVTLAYTVTGKNVTEGKAINNGSYTITVSGISGSDIEKGYYTLTGATGVSRDFSIGAQNVAVTWAETTFTYNGNVQAINGLATTDKGITLTVVVDNGAAFKNADTYTLRVSTDSEDYNITNPTHEYTIDAFELTVTFGETKSWVYDRDAHKPDVSVNSFGFDDVTVVWMNGYNDKVNASINSSYTGIVESLTGSDHANYKLPEAVEARSVSFTITPRPITVTIRDAFSLYGADKAALIGDITTGELCAGDSNPYTLSCDVSKTSNAGEYAIVGEGISDNYAVTFAGNYSSNASNGKYTVNKRPITVTIDSISSYYGDEQAALTSSVTTGMIVNDDENVWAVSCFVGKTTDVGDYPISGNVLNNNYTITFVGAYVGVTGKGNYSVLPRPISVSIANKGSIYGDAIETLTASITEGNLVNEDANPWTLSTTATSESAVGAYAINGNGSNSNYAVTFGPSGVYTISARPITVSIANSTSVYGDDKAALTAGITEGNLVNDDDDPWTLTCVANNVSAVGEYAINGAGADDNYAVKFGPSGVYTVTARAITVTIADSTSVYGDAAVALNSEITKGNLVNSDTNVWKLNCEADSTKDAGAYAITGEVLNNNYNVTFVNGTYTITVRPITVTIDSKSGVYGDAIVAFTSAITAGNLVNDDANPWTVSSTVAVTSNVGSYDITGTDIDDNYDVTFVNGTYTITVRPITVTIADKTSVYGATIVALTSAVTQGNVANDDAQPWSVACTVAANSAVGPYAITGTGIDSNYNITFVNGTYTLTNAALTGVSVAQKGTLTYTGADQVATVNTAATAIYDGETAAFSYSTAADGTFSATVPAFKNAGSYTVYYVVELANYAEVSGTFTVTIDKKALTVTAEDKAITYGDYAPTYTEAYDGFVTGEDKAVLGGTLAFACDYVQFTSKDGSYDIVPSGLTSGNYAITFVKGTLTVAKGNFEEVKEDSTGKVSVDIDDKASAAATGVDINKIIEAAAKAGDNAGLTLTVGEGDSASKLVLDAAAIASLKDKDVKLSYKATEGDAKGDALTLEISLGVDFQGSVTITAPFVNAAPGGKVAKLFYVGADGKKVDMNAVFEGDTVTFTTDHFSTYVVNYVLSTGSIVGIIVAVVVVVAAVIVVIIIVSKKKKGAAPKADKAESKPAEAAADTSADVEETKSEDAADASEPDGEDA